MRLPLALALLSLLPLGLTAAAPPKSDPKPAAAPAAPSDEDLAAEVEKERKVAERFLTLLERNPREGTSLDKAYAFFVEQGQLDDLVARYRDRVAKNDADGVAWQILGLIESRRGNDAPAIEALKKAAEHRPADPMAAYYLGRAYAVTGRADQAAAAFEQAVARKPARADLPPILAELGRLHQRAGRAEDAAKTWDRLEAAFPGDLRVKAEIAAVLEEEGQPELALARYDALAKAATDEYRKVTYGLKAAGLKARLGKRDEAVAAFEKLLAGLNPDNWLYREVRRGIENAFLRTDDTDGLIAYYEKWIAAHPEDVAAMSRLAELLGDAGRGEDARGWFDKATKLAPSDARLRRAYIEALRRAGKTTEAVAQFEALDKANPNDPDVIRDWGTVYLEDKSTPEADRKANAAAVWKRLAAAKPKDPVVTAQVADWLRQATLSDDALALYRKAAELAPDDPRYVEYLGEYLHQLGKKDEAVATWRKLAEGKNRNPANLVRLAEVLSGFGYKDEALVTFREADPLDLGFADRLRYATLLRDQEQYDPSLEQIAKAEKLAESDEERQSALAARVQTDQAANRLEARIAELRKAAADKPSTAAWLTLALYLEAARDSAGAAEAARDAVNRDPRSVPAQATLARLADAAGQLSDAVEAFRRLAALDRRGRAEYLKQAASLEQRLGQSDAALATAREVLAAAPGSPDGYAFYADLCFRLGKDGDGLDALRRAARSAPTDPGPVLSLAAALADRFRTDEATELYWQAFDRAGSYDDKAPIVDRLAELYLRTNRFDDLVKRLGRVDTTGNVGGGGERESKLLVAEAYQAIGDLGRAGETLQSLLAENPRDKQLLGRLSQLAERDRDYETALKYQKEVVALAKDDKQEKSRLAQLYLAAGETAGPEAEDSAFWDSLAESDLDAVETLNLIDALLGAQRYDDALRVTDRALRDAPKDWELLYRRAFALLKQDGKKDQAADAFRLLLALDVSDDAESAKLAALRKKTATQTTQTAAQSAAARRAASFPKVVTRTQSAGQIQAVLGFRGDGVYSGGSASTRALAWVPQDFGAARLAAVIWLGFAGPDAEKFRAALQAAAEAPNAPPRALWDWFGYLTSDSQSRSRLPGAAPGATRVREAAKRLAQLGGTDGAWVYLLQVINGQPPGGANARQPLPKDDLDLLLACFERVRHENAGPYSTIIATTVARELKLAGRDEEAKALVREMLAATTDAAGLGMIFQIAASAEDLETTNAVLDRLEALPPDKLSASSSNSYYYTSRLMRSLWDAGKHDEATKLFDRELALSARRHSAPKKSSASSTSQSRSSGRYGISYWKKGGQQDNIVVDSSDFNDYVGVPELTLLRTAYEFHKEENKADDFAEGLAKKGENATGPAAALARLSAAAVANWQGHKDAALDQTRAALDAMPDDFVLRLALATQYKTQGRSEDALAVLDAVEPFDPNQLRDRELAALDLAASLSRVDRAKAAAERLFGLRLDAQQQLRLANVMQQVGMASQAEAVLARVRTQGRGAGNQTQIELLRHYRTKGDTATASEIARDIVRRTKANPDRSRRTSEDVYREEAVKLLKDLGQLDTLIADAKRQADRAPGSVEAQRQLADYYAAAGRNEEAVAVLKAVSDKRPSDADLKYDLANRVAALGKAGDSIDLYAAAINAKPELFSRNYYEMERTFAQAGRHEDLLKLIGKIDFSKGGELHYAMNAISNSLNRTSAPARAGAAAASPDTLHDAALAAMESLWEKNPARRAEILQQIHNEKIWESPKLAAYALGVLKGEGGPPDWDAVGNTNVYYGDGRVGSLFGNLLTASRFQKDNAAFQKTVGEVLEKHKDWGPGQGMLASLEAEQGKNDEARARVKALLDDKQHPLPAQAAWVLGLELERHEKFRDLAVACLERAATEGTRNGLDEFQYSPQARLVKLYGEVGRKEDARTILLTKGLEKTSDRYSDPAYQAYAEMRNYTGVGKKLLDLGYPIDALRIFDRYAGDPARVQAAKQQGRYELQQLEAARKTALASIDAPKVAAFLAAAAKEEPKGDSPALDLVLTVSGTELAQTQIDSVITSAVVQALSGKPVVPPGATRPLPPAGSEDVAINRSHWKPPGAADPAKPPAEPKSDAVRAIRGDLAALRDKRPDDLSVQVIAAVAAFTSDDLDAAKVATERLVRLAEAADEKKPKDGPAAAAPPDGVALWLVAREAAKHEATKPLADDLAARAVAAARRNKDNRWLVAMLRERGQLALDAGDRAAAESAWSEALDQILPKPAEKGEEKPKEQQEKKPAAGRAAASVDVQKPGISVGWHALTTGRAWRASRDVRSSGGARHGHAGRATQPAPTLRLGPSHRAAALVALALLAQPAAAEPAVRPPVNADRATQALELAELAAKYGMDDLSVRAVRESLGSGRPINLAPTDTSGTRVISSSGVSDVARIEQQVAERLAKLDAAWREKGADPAGVYTALADAVLPPGRKAEVFLYPQPLSSRESDAPDSGGRLLVVWAAKAGRVDDLARRLAERPADGPDAVQVQALRALAAYEANDLPAAKAALEGLKAKLGSGAATRDAELACHAALPGLAKPEVRDAAADALSAAVGRLADSGNEQPFGWITLRLAEQEFDRGRPEEAEKRLDGYVSALAAIYSRYSGDYAAYRRREVLQTVARTLARHGRGAAALDRLGEALDMPVTQYGGSAGSSGLSISGLARSIAADASPDAYERLKAWTLPKGERKSVRLLTTMTVSEVPPAEFSLAPDPAEAVLGPGRVPVVTGTAVALVALAKRGGKLPELTAEADRLAGEKVENAETLALLARIAVGDGAKVAGRFSAVADAFVAKPVDQVDFQGPEVPNLLLVASAAASDPSLRPAVVKLLPKVEEASHGKGNVIQAASRLIATECAALDAGLVPSDVLLRDDFGPWQVARMPRAEDHRNPRVPAIWAVREGVARHLAGSQMDPLVFRLPLGGSFDLVADALDDSYAESHVGFGGLTYETFAWSQKVRVAEAGGYGQTERTFEGLRKGFNEVRIEVRPGSTRCVVNGTEMHRDDSPSAASPFLVLSALFGRNCAFRGVRIDGEPSIPREVRLVDGERLDGWSDNLFGGGRPVRPGTDAAPQTREPTWTVSGGVVTAKVLPSANKQSLLGHHRPLWDGESVEYEFLAGGGNGIAHPALGRLVFLLTPEGVKLHWAVGEGADEWTGLAADNAVDVPQYRRGGGAAVKAGEWNAVKVAVAGGAVRVELNGELVFERPLAEADSRLFGLFRSASEPVQVRNVVLRGDWPQRLDAAAKADLLAIVPSSADPKLVRYERAAIGTENFSGQGWEGLNRLAAEPAARRYERLLAAVLPTSSTPMWRLGLAFSPADPPPGVVGYGIGTAKGPRGHVGGRVVSAAGLLVETAAELGRLDDLAAKVEAAAAQSDVDRRAQAAVRVMVSAAKGDNEGATAVLKGMLPLLKGVPAPAGEEERWPELIAADAALDHTALVPPALALLDWMVVEQLQKEAQKSVGLSWARHARTLRGEAQALAETGVARADLPSEPPLLYWHTGGFDRAEDRGSGEPRPLWQLRPGGEVAHRGGPNWEYLHLTTPLRGDFEVRCTLPIFGWREQIVRLAGVGVAPRYDRKNYEIHEYGREMAVKPLPGPVEIAPSGTYDYRAAVKGGTLTAWVNGVKIHEQPLPAGYDPWVAISAAGEKNGGVRDFTISGSPTVPEEVELSAAADLSGWQGYYPGRLRVDGARWQKKGEEIYGPKQPAGAVSEAALHYHRPMYEDGAVSYEFYYEPGESKVHPALDRLVFLMEPDGVRVRWLTDATFDRTGFPLKNGVVEAGRRRGPAKLPLKEGDWNAVTLAVTGDTATVALNGETVYKRPVEPTNQRTFGLFRFVDAEEARVRNVRYRGDWPKELPAADTLFAVRP